MFLAIDRFEKENTSTCIVTDVGTVQTEAARLITVARERAYITSGGLGAMGFSLPGAIGASFAMGDIGKGKDDRIIAIAGDGGFQMTLQEMGILSECPVPVKIIVMNNRCLGMVNDMEIGRGGKYDMGDTPDISLIAKAYGVNSERVELSDNIEEKIYRFLSAPDSALIEIMFDNSEVTR